MYILAHDLGTSGNKATLFSSDGRILESAFIPYETFYGPNGEAEQEPEDWWNAVIKSTRRLLDLKPDAATQTAAIGFSGHMMGCLALDGDGNALGRAWLHSDIRSAKQSTRVSETLGAKRFFDITGNPADPHYPFSKIMWLKENCPELYSNAACFLQSKDYIVGRLTGKYGVTDFTDASLSGLFDITRRRWSDEILEASGIDLSKMPEVVESRKVIGGISHTAALATGLKQGIPVVIGGGDGACAAVGAAATEPGDAYNYIGSTSWISAITKEPLLDEQMRLFVLCNLDASTYSVLGTVQSAGTSYEWASNSLCEQESARAERDGVSKYKLMDDLARQAPAGSDMLIFLPYLMGERAPIWDANARGAYFGLSINHSRAHLLRAVLEGVAYALRSIIDVIEESSNSIKSVTTIGGGAEGMLWREILASVFNRNIVTPEHLQEATSYGAAIAAGIGVGLFENYSVAKKLVRIREEIEPDPSVTKVYGRCYSIFRELYPALKDSFSSLASMRAEI